MIDPIITAKVLCFVAMLVLGENLSQMIREYSSSPKLNTTDNPF